MAIAEILGTTSAYLLGATDDPSPVGQKESSRHGIELSEKVPYGGGETMWKKIFDTISDITYSDIFDAELESEYKWSRVDCQSARNQLIEKGYAKVTVNH